ncbi:MAG: glycolate oxidase subunit GlcE [Burkholderiaceae bacterium]|jgi:glycolate oxidase FAD binding subunit|nr:glycolate oxidase subunit GlcE [Burkholderiaceae bacterium]
MVPVDTPVAVSVSASDPAVPIALRGFAERIREAAAQGQPLCIRGHGSKDFLGSPPRGAVLDTRPLCGIVSYEPSELVITALAGTPLAELEAALAEKGQCLPFEPPRFADPADAGQRALNQRPLHQGTVGGMVAAGLAGPARASAGSVRDYILGALLINGRAQVLRFGGQVMKNVAGYDVSRVLAGSLGVLGLIAEVSLKVLSHAPAQATLSFACDQAEALRQLNHWGAQPLPLSASTWHQGTLHLRLRGAVAAVEAACHTLSGLGGLDGTRVDAAAAESFWKGCRDQCLPFFERASGLDLWRLSVPQTAAPLALDAPPLIEWHGAQRWYRLPAGQAQRVRAAARAAGGHATLFAAAERADATPRFDALAPPLERIHRALKCEFDPQGIFNPGRFYAGF